jgi:predicted glycosyltransferase involved in capsule biosynthesis
MNVHVKYDLSDITFVIPVRIESDYRKENLETLLKVINRDFVTNLIVLEADKVSLFRASKEIKNISYYFIYDKDPIYFRTHYINILLQLSTTPYVGIWDTDAFASPNQIIEAVEILRKDIVVMAFPFDRRYYEVNEILRKAFLKVLMYELLISHIPAMNLKFGYQAVGGAFLVNRDKYIAAGMENENFYGWGEEDNERVKRMEILDLSIYYTPGPLFHLWHPVGLNSWYPSVDIEIKNRKEFIKTCSSK